MVGTKNYYQNIILSLAQINVHASGTRTNMVDLRREFPIARGRCACKISSVVYYLHLNNNIKLILNKEKSFGECSIKFSLKVLSESVEYNLRTRTKIPSLPMRN